MNTQTNLFNFQENTQEEREGFMWNGKWISQESIEKSTKDFYEMGGDY